MKEPAILSITIPNEDKYIRVIENAISYCGILSYIYDTDTIMNGKEIMHFNIFLQYHDISFIHEKIKKIIECWYDDFYLNLDEIEIVELYDLNNFDFGYDSNTEDHILSKFEDIIVSDIDIIGYKYPIITQHLNTFNTYESIKNNLLILSIINDKQYKSVLFIGKEYSLYNEIAKDNYSFNMDSCDINEFNDYTNNKYDCIFINGYLNGDHILDILNIFKDIKCIIVSGILIPEYEKEYFHILNNFTDQYQTIQSHYWKSCIIGDLNIDKYNMI